MTSKRLIIAVLLFTSLSLEISSYEQPWPTSTGRHNWCGRTLIRNLQIVCDATYYALFQESSETGKSAKAEASTGQLEAIQSTTLQTRIHRFPLEIAVGDQRKRIRRGIVDECCFQGCTIAVLQSYCAN